MKNTSIFKTLICLSLILISQLSFAGRYCGMLDNSSAYCVTDVEPPAYATNCKEDPLLNKWNCVIPDTYEFPVRYGDNNDLNNDDDGCCFCHNRDNCDAQFNSELPIL